MTRVARVTLVLAFVAGSPAFGDEIAAVEPIDPAPCGIRLVRAPADLGTTVATRLRELGACEHRLDVWLVRAEAGVFVVASDHLGRVRDRVVSDADVAATLIASWAEHSFVLASHPAPVPPPPPMLAPVVDVERAASPPPPKAAGWRSVGLVAFAGATNRGMTTSGAIADVDLLRHSGVTIGAAARFHRDVDSSFYVVRWADGFFEETSRWGGAALLVMRWPLVTSRWRITPGVGLGVGVAEHEVLTAVDGGIGAPADPILLHDTSVGPRIEGSASIGYRITDRIELEVEGGWMFGGYSARSVGVDPTDHAIHGALGLRLR